MMAYLHGCSTTCSYGAFLLTGIQSRPKHGLRWVHQWSSLMQASYLKVGESGKIDRGIVEVGYASASQQASGCNHRQPGAIGSHTNLNNIAAVCFHRSLPPCTYKWLRTSSAETLQSLLVDKSVQQRASLLVVDCVIQSWARALHMNQMSSKREASGGITYQRVMTTVQSNCIVCTQLPYRSVKQCQSNSPSIERIFMLLSGLKDLEHLLWACAVHRVYICMCVHMCARARDCFAL